MSYSIKTLRFNVSDKSGDVGGIFVLPEKPEFLLLLAHGAGAGMNHSFMEKMAACLADEQIATFRYNFPYSEKGMKRPDHSSVLMKTVKSAFLFACENVPGIPILAGGKSMGGRMTSNAASKGLLTGVKGIIFFGFPLHAPGNPSDERSRHLFEVKIPMLFLQGSKDKLADLTLLKPIVAKLGNEAVMHIIEGADHSFHLPKSSGKTDEDIYHELADVIKRWAEKNVPLK